MFKNASQKWTVLAFDRSTGARVTGDAANISAKICKADQAASPLTDASPDEIEDGLYRFDVSADESNADKLELLSESSTANVIVIGLPMVAYTKDSAFSEIPTASEIRAEMDANSTQLAAILEDTGTSLPVSIAGTRSVVDSIYTDTDTTIPATLAAILEDTGTSLVTQITGVRGVVDAVLEDTGTTIPGTISTLDGYLDTEVAAIKAVTDKVEDTLEDAGGGVFRFTASALAKSHSSPTISQVFVPSSRTWRLMREASGGLKSEGPALGMQVGEDLLFSADFGRELGNGDWLAAISAVEINAGTASGVTFDAADQGTNGSLCKFSIGAVTAGAYTIRVKVTSNDSQTLEADCELKVVAA